jgi:hypothetical protein
VEPIDYVYTVGMDDEEVTERLEANGTGVLSLADGGRAYAVPVNYRYRDDRLHVRLSDDGNSEKLAFVEATEEACFLLYRGTPPEDAWSILLTGRLREATEVSREEIAGDLDPLRVFDESIDEVTVRIYEFEVYDVTGRKASD